MDKFSWGRHAYHSLQQRRLDIEDEEIASVTVNDISDGICADIGLHNHHFKLRETPNPILGISDIPDRCQRDLYLDATYPRNSRYTLQWIIVPPGPQFFFKYYPNNNVATFMNQSLPKPADVSVLTNRPDLPRPSVPSPAPLGSTRITHDRIIATNKRAGTTSQQGAGNERNTSGEAADFEAQGGWDEDDVILFLWGNYRAARERHAKMEQERTEYLEKWRGWSYVV